MLLEKTHFTCPACSVPHPNQTWALPGMPVLEGTCKDPVQLGVWWNVLWCRWRLILSIWKRVTPINLETTDRHETLPGANAVCSAVASYLKTFLALTRHTKPCYRARVDTSVGIPCTPQSNVASLSLREPIRHQSPAQRIPSPLDMAWNMNQLHHLARLKQEIIYLFEERLASLH